MPASEIAADPKYALPEGGFDLATRLADNRARFPELLAVDPDAEMNVGDRASAKAVMLVAAGLPIGLTLLLGALATAIARYRRGLLAAGVVAMGSAVTVALAIELALAGVLSGLAASFGAGRAGRAALIAAAAATLVAALAGVAALLP